MKRTRTDGRRLILAAIAGICAWIVPCAPLSAQVGRTVINVKDTHTYGSPPVTYPGAVGDGIADDTVAIQGSIGYALYSASNRQGKGAAIFFPEGKYRVTNQITIPSGEACLDFVGASGNGFTGDIPPSTIIGDMSPDNGHPLFYYQGAGSRWSDLVIAARATAASGTPPAIIQTASASALAGVQQITFERVFFWSHADFSGPLSIVGTAVSFGGAPLEAMNSECSFRHCAFYQFGTCVKVNTNQGLDYVFEQIGAGHCTTFLDLTTGGNVSVNVATFSACGGTGADDWIFKLGANLPNGGVTKVTNARFESGCTQFVRVDGTQLAIFDGLSENTPGTTDPVIQVGGGSLTMNSCSFQSFPVLRFVTPADSWVVGSIRYRDCCFPMYPPGGTAGGTKVNAPLSPAPPPSGLILGTGRFVYQHCTGAYHDMALVPLSNLTNVSGW